MEVEEIQSDVTESTSASHVVVILGEIMGATNLKAALRREGGEAGRSYPHSRDSVNAFCDVYWGRDLIHRTQKITKK